MADFNRSVVGVLICDGKVLLARHTYGPGKGKLIIPGGYIEEGEMPEEALAREFMEEVGITVRPLQLIGMRFNTKDWYAVFAVEHIAGQARSDRDENSEVVWMPVDEALSHDDVPDLSKKLIECALTSGWHTVDYIGRNPPYKLYGKK